MAEKTTIHICITCRAADDPSEERAGARLYRNVRDLAAERGDDVDVIPVECLSVCKRPVTFGFSAAGKWTYVYADAPAESAAATILDGAALYAAAPDGLIPWKQRPDALKKGVVSRVPPLSAPSIPETVPEAAE